MLVRGTSPLYDADLWRTNFNPSGHPDTKATPPFGKHFVVVDQYPLIHQARGSDPIPSSQTIFVPQRQLAHGIGFSLALLELFLLFLLFERLKLLFQ